MTDYAPVDCGLHSEYELAILRGKQLRISWHNPDGQTRTETMRPVDLQTRNHEEFLVVETAAGNKLQLRLDSISRFEIT